LITLDAIPEGDEYRLWAEKSHVTYNRRAMLKECGARWDGKYWFVDKDALTKLRERCNILQVLAWARLRCDCKAEDWYLVHEDKAHVGDYASAFCGRCDSRGYYRVLEVR
jgi:hypothetical protein